MRSSFDYLCLFGISVLALQMQNRLDCCPRQPVPTGPTTPPTIIPHGMPATSCIGQAIFVQMLLKCDKAAPMRHCPTGFVQAALPCVSKLQQISPPPPALDCILVSPVIADRYKGWSQNGTARPKTGRNIDSTFSLILLQRIAVNVVYD